ncbi:hypothetical protein PLUTE_b0901 [Pseudoalteromonas luteoviolacea DSM 6061]|nr:hypothetical protein [Pseudoalteromonas luteoviolacea DSM 6061]
MSIALIFGLCTYNAIDLLCDNQQALALASHLTITVNFVLEDQPEG